MRGNGSVDLLDDSLAHGAGRDEHLPFTDRVAVAGKGVEQVCDLLPDLPVCREHAEVLVQAGILGVKIAGADHHVVAHAAALAPDDDDRLGVRLEPRDPMHHVRAGLLQGAGPLDIQALVGILVWLFADYKHDDTFLRWIHPVAMIAAVGLAHVGRARSERAVGSKSKRGAINNDQGIDLVAGAHRGEHIGLVVVIPRGGAERRVHDRRPRRQPQVGVSLDPGDLRYVRKVEEPIDVIHLELVDPEPLDQPRPDLGIHAGVDLEPHDLAEAPATELVLDRLKQVVGLVVDLEVGVPGDAEQVVADDLHPREQRVEVVGDDVLERDEDVLGDLHEPW